MQVLRILEHGCGLCERKLDIEKIFWIKMHHADTTNVFCAFRVPA